MWCVPTAVAAVTTLSREQVWLRILAERQARGRRLTNVPGPISEPHGGCHAAEGLRVVKACRLQPQDAWPGTRRMKLAEFIAFTKSIDNGASFWLVLQPTHFAHYDGLDSSHSFVGPTIVKAWRIVAAGQPATLY